MFDDSSTGGAGIEKIPPLRLDAGTEKNSNRTNVIFKLDASQSARPQLGNSISRISIDFYGKN